MSVYNVDVDVGVSSTSEHYWVFTSYLNSNMNVPHCTLSNYVE